MTVSSSPTPASLSRSKGRDIIDDLTGSTPVRAPVRSLPVDTFIDSPTATFSLTVPSKEAARASVFLQRVKALLEKEPEKLIL